MRWVLFIAALIFAGIGCNKKVAILPAPETSGQTPPTEGDPFETMRKEARSTNNAFISRAIDGAVSLDRQGTDVIPFAKELLTDPSCGTSGVALMERPTSARQAGVMILTRLGDKAKVFLNTEAADLLKAGVKDPKPNVREHTLVALAMLGEPASKLKEDILVACGDTDADVRGAAYLVIKQAKVDVGKGLYKYLSHDNAGVCISASNFIATQKVKASELKTLIAALKHTDPFKELPEDGLLFANNVADAIGGLGSEADTAIPELIGLIKSADLETFDKMLTTRKPGQTRPETGPMAALRRMGKTSVKEVIPLLKDENPLVRYQAAGILAGIGSEAGEAGGEILSAIEADLKRPRLTGYAFDALVIALIRTKGDIDKGVALVSGLLDSPQALGRVIGLSVISRFGKKASPSLKRIIELLEDGDPDVEAFAVEALIAMGPAAKEATAVLADRYLKGDPRAGEALGKIGPASASVVKEIVKGFDNPEFSKRALLDILKGIGPSAAPDSLEKVAAFATDPKRNQPEKIAAFETLASFGNAAKPKVNVVLAMLSSKEQSDRLLAYDTLGAIMIGDPSKAKETLVGLTDSNINVRIAALRALTRMGKNSAGEEIATFTNNTKDPAAKIWGQACLILQNRDVKANTDAILAAIKNSTKENRIARFAALEAAGYLGEKGKPLASALAEQLRDKSTLTTNGQIQARHLAARSLGLLGASGVAGVPSLSGLIRDGDLESKRIAITSLGKIGPGAIAAVSRLRDVAESEPLLAESANNALELIESK